jgi:hypothetical protein
MAEACLLERSSIVQKLLEEGRRSSGRPQVEVDEELVAFHSRRICDGRTMNHPDRV